MENKTENKLNTKKVMKGILLSFILCLCITAYEYNKNKQFEAEQKVIKKETMLYAGRIDERVDRVVDLTEDIFYYLELADEYAFEQSFKVEMDCEDFLDSMRHYMSDYDSLQDSHEELMFGVDKVREGSKIMNDMWARVVNSMTVTERDIEDKESAINLMEMGLSSINEALGELE